MMKRVVQMPMALFLVSFVLNSGQLLAVLPPLSQAASLTPAKGWTATWGGSESDSVNRVGVDGSGNLYMAGEYTGTVDFDPAGETIDFHTSNNDSIDAFLSKFDKDGNFLWAKTWGGSKRDVAYGVGVDSSGNAYVVGPFMDTVDFNPDPDLFDIHASNAISGTIYHNNIYLSKFAPDGTYQWVRTWGPSYVTNAAGGAEGYTVSVDGNYLYVVGDFSGATTDFNPWGDHDYHTNHPPVSGPIFFDAFLSKFDLDGNFQWAKTWGGEGYDDGPGVAVDGAGNVYVAGMYASQAINFDPTGGSGGLGHPAHDSGAMVDVFLSKFGPNGEFQWVKTWGGQATEDAMGTVVVDNANYVYVAGRFSSINCDFNPGGTPDIHSTNGGQDAFLSKFASDGSFQWARTWGGSDSDNIMGLAVDGIGHVYASGWFSGAFDFNPGSGVDDHASNGGRDAFLSQLDSGGNYNWAITWGGSGDDSSSVILDGMHKLYASGEFVGEVDFDPGSGVDTHTSNGGSDAFLSHFLLLSQHVYLPLVNNIGP